MSTTPSTKLRAHVQPGARQTKLVSLVDGVLRVKLSAPPVEGRANVALIEVLADALGVARSNVEVVRGHSSRDKLVVVHGIGEEEVMRKLTMILG